MRRVARESVVEGVDVVVVVGGDGSLNVVANQLVNTETALGIIPAGTANDLARALKIPLTPRESCRAILNGEIRTIDVGRVNGRYFLTGGGIGIVNDVAEGVHALKSRSGLLGAFTRALGSAAYPLFSGWLVLSAAKIPQTVTLCVDGRDRVQSVILALFIQNQPFIGRTVTSCPHTRQFDGSLGYCRIDWRTRARSLWIAALLNRAGAHEGAEEVELGEGKTFTLVGDEPLSFMADGEPLARAETLEIAVIPAGLRVVSPSA